MKTSKGMRIQIGIFGRRNVGKSSFLNALTGQPVSIVSETPGTTTDPVEKAMELLPIGPVLFIDTAGIDDRGALGGQRIARSLKTIERADLAVVVAEADQWGGFEENLLQRLAAEKVPAIVVFNKSDLARPDRTLTGRLEAAGISWMEAQASRGAGIDLFKQRLLEKLPEDLLAARPIAGDLIRPGETAVLVVPIDLEAPRGRLILPQVQTIRDLLDHDAACLVVKETGLARALADLKTPPALVVTDSQAFGAVARLTPPEIPLTSFSILFARLKGDLATFAEGALAIDRLQPGDRVLIAEACTHHPVGDDIGRVQIPRLLAGRLGRPVETRVVAGHDFPGDLGDYRLVIHCGSCMFNRKEVLFRIMRCQQAGVPITNYGIALAYCGGIFRRALAPFPEVKPLISGPAGRLNGKQREENQG